MVDFSEHLKRANIFHSSPALVDKRILSQLVDLTNTPGQRGFILGEEMSHGKPGGSFELKAYDSTRQLQGIIIRDRSGYARIIYLKIPSEQLEKARSYIRHLSAKYCGYR